MNDFGVFKAISELIRADQTLNLTAVVTETRPGMVAPYALVRFEESQVDIPCLVQTALVKCTINITSCYHGDQEIHQLMSGLNFRLDGAVLPVHMQALGANGTAIFKHIGQDLVLDGGNRIGKLTYQILIRRK